MSRLKRSCTVLLLALWGCQQPVAPAQPTSAHIAVPSRARFEHLWECCCEVLRDHRFKIDRRDLYSGIISTHPETAQGILEFWRHDVDTPYDLAYAQAHAVRRTAEIYIEPSETQEDYVLDVRVRQEKYHTIERQITNPAAALRVFSPEFPTTRGPKIQQQRDTYWTPQGRDGAMEARLLRLIKSRYEN